MGNILLGTREIAEGERHTETAIVTLSRRSENRLVRIGIAFAAPRCQMTLPFTLAHQPNGKQGRTTMAEAIFSASEAAPVIIHHFKKFMPLWGELVALGPRNPGTSIRVARPRPGWTPFRVP